MKLLAMIALSSVVLAGCVTAPGDEFLFGRPDCQGVQEGEAGTRFQLDRQVCLGRADAASARRSGGLADVRHGVMLACMGERGYLWARRSEHAGRCGHVPSARPPQAAASPPTSARPPPASATPSADRPTAAECEALANESERLHCFLARRL